MPTDIGREVADVLRWVFEDDQQAWQPDARDLQRALNAGLIVPGRSGYRPTEDGELTYPAVTR